MHPLEEERAASGQSEARVSQQAAGGTDDEAPPVPDLSAVQHLLRGYQALLDYTSHARRTGIVRRLWKWGLDRFAIEHVRASLANLERRYDAHAALATRPDRDAAEGRARIAQLTASLPPAPSRLRAVWLAAGILVVARVLFELFGSADYGSGEAGKELADAAARVGDLNPSHISELTDLLLRTSLVQTAYVVATFGLAAYLVLRPLATGAIAFRTLLHGKRERRRFGLYESERQLADRLRLSEREASVFGPVGLAPATDSRIDLVAKACLVAPLLLSAALSWHLYDGALGRGAGGWGPSDVGAYGYRVYERAGLDALTVVVLGTIAVLRLTWLGLAARRPVSSSAASASGSRSSRSGYALASFAGLLALVVAFGTYALWDHRPPSVWVETSPVTARDLRRSTEFCATGVKCAALDIRYACDEPCHVVIRLLGSFDRNTLDSIELPERLDPIPAFSNGSRPVPAAQGIGTGALSLFEDLPPPGATEAELWAFSLEQSRWLQEELERLGHDVQIEVQAWDDAGNTTTLETGFVSAERS